MPTFLLVHGAWHGGWCYGRVARSLRNAGHDVHAPTLTGVGEREHLSGPDIDLSTHIRDILNLIAFEELDDFVLCGHSYAGMVVTGVADAIAPKLRALVYLDAFVPDDGNSIMDLVTEQRRQLILAGAAGGYRVPAPPPESYDVNPRDIEWVRGKLTTHPLASLQQPIRLTGAHAHVARRIYVYARDRATSAPFHEKCRADPSWTVHVWDGGHDQMIDQPDAVARLLIDAAG